MKDNRYEIPVVLIVFRRLDTVKMIMDKIREIQPKRFYVFSDGARAGEEEERKQVEQVRQYVQAAIDWECDAHLEFAERNKGCAKNICEGLDKVFSIEKRAVFLEDDAVPMTEFFVYCQTLLLRYENEQKIQYIAGFNAVGDTDAIGQSYSFSASAPMSGAIATWADRWNNCDFSMKSWPECRRRHGLRRYYHYREAYKIHLKDCEASYRNINDGWDYQFCYDMLDKQRLAIVPKGNLARSYGFTQGAFHPQEKREADRLKKIMDYTREGFTFPMDEPGAIELNWEYDRLRQKLRLEVKGNWARRHLRYAVLAVKDAAYGHMPQNVWLFLRKVIKGR